MAETITCVRCGKQIRIERGAFGQTRELNADGKAFHYIDCAGGKEAVEKLRRDIEAAERKRTGTR